MIRFVIFLAAFGAYSAYPAAPPKIESTPVVVPIISEDIDVEPDGSYHYR